MEFDDIRILPAPISYIESRADVCTDQSIVGDSLSLPLISSNMKSVYSPLLSEEILKFGSKAVVHRFSDIKDIGQLFWDGAYQLVIPWGSVGVSEQEFSKAALLVERGCKVLILEVANAAHISCIKQYNKIAKQFPDAKIIVGTFATKYQYEAFRAEVVKTPDAILGGIGVGSHCRTTRYVTGVGLPVVETILSLREAGVPVILSGGVDKPADFVKALALGATAVMVGRQFAACIESGAKNFYFKDGQYLKTEGTKIHPTHKWYFGSASLDAYRETGKEAAHRAVEGDGSMIPITGTVGDMLLDYHASLRSAMTYCNARTLEEFRANAKIYYLNGKPCLP